MKDRLVKYYQDLFFFGTDTHHPCTLGKLVGGFSEEQLRSHCPSSLLATLGRLPFSCSSLICSCWVGEKEEGERRGVGMEPSLAELCQQITGLLQRKGSIELASLGSIFSVRLGKYFIFFFERRTERDQSFINVRKKHILTDKKAFLAKARATSIPRAVCWLLWLDY